MKQESEREKEKKFVTHFDSIGMVFCSVCSTSSFISVAKYKVKQKSDTLKFQIFGLILLYILGLEEW